MSLWWPQQVLERVRVLERALLLLELERALELEQLLVPLVLVLVQL